jgi:hypothetical protein
LQKLLEANGFAPNETFIFSYQASSKIDAAALMLSFVQRVRPGVKLIIHRDRDFMTDDEVGRLKTKYSLPQGVNVGILITKFSDVEGYFAQAAHLAASLQLSPADMETLVGTVVQEYNNEFVLKFRDKREEIKKTLYRNDEENCPSTATLIPAAQITVENAMGKLLLSRLGPKLQEAGKNPSQLVVESEALKDAAIQALA